MADNDQKISLTKVRGRLFELIFDMTEADSRALKEELEIRGHPEHKQKEKRKHPRKKTFIHIDCSGNKCAFTDFIQNISNSGLYIETQIPLFNDQELSMIFSPPGAEDPVSKSSERLSEWVQEASECNSTSFCPALRSRLTADANLLTDFSSLIDQQSWKMKILGG